MIHFSKYTKLYILISALFLVPGIVSLVIFGLRPAVDFTGGTLLEVQYPVPVLTSEIERLAQDQGIELSSIQDSSDTSIIIRLKPQGEQGDQLYQFRERILAVASPSGVILRNDEVGPTLGAELLKKTIFAAGIVVIAILSYIAWAFKTIRFGISAVIALLHDLFIVLGMFSLFGYFFGVEVDTLFVTAALTTMSFSVHDTIVVFDRVREIRAREPKFSLEDATDKALTQTMGRSLTNSFTIIFMLLALVLLGGETVRWFVIALLIGTISGTYSSPFVAVPALITISKLSSKK